MKYCLLLLAFACFAFVPTFSQTCASPFAVGNTGFNEVCTVSGAAGPYTLSITATSDSALAIVGLWEVPQTTISADVDCNTQTFTIPRQTLFSGYEIEGSGSLSMPNVGVTYEIYATPDTVTPIDICSGAYMAATVGIRPSIQAQLTLAPNPAHDLVQLQATGLGLVDGPRIYRVIDLQGRVVTEGLLDDRQSAEIELKGLSQGMYRVMVQDGAGQFASKVLVVQ